MKRLIADNFYARAAGEGKSCAREIILHDGNYMEINDRFTRIIRNIRSVNILF